MRGLKTMKTKNWMLWGLLGWQGMATAMVTLPSQITAVTVHPGLATVTRTVAVSLPAGELLIPCDTPRGERIAVALTEGWRGEICHVAITDAAGRFARYKITDPSFHNWSGLAMALRNEQISDFPLCNKSFNLSYCGFDL